MRIIAQQRAIAWQCDSRMGSTTIYFSHTLWHTLKPKLNGCHFADSIFRYIIPKEYFSLLMHILEESVPYGPVHNMSALVSPVQNQAITLFNVDQDLFHHMPSLANWSHYENTPHSLTMSIKLCPFWACGGNFTISWQEGHHCNKIVFQLITLYFYRNPMKQWML